MYCKNCDISYDSTQKFCNMCGAPLEKEQQPAEDDDKTVLIAQQQPQMYGQSAPQQQMYGGPAPQQQMYGGPAPQQQMYGGPAPQQHMYGGPAPQQQMYGGPAPQQHMYGGPAPQQQMYGGPAPQQQMYGQPQRPYQPYQPSSGFQLVNIFALIAGILMILPLVLGNIFTSNSNSYFEKKLDMFAASKDASRYLKKVSFDDVPDDDKFRYIAMHGIKLLPYVTIATIIILILCSFVRIPILKGIALLFEAFSIASVIINVQILNYYGGDYVIGNATVILCVSWLIGFISIFGNRKTQRMY